MVKPEELFGINAGKVWHILREKGSLSAKAIAKETGIKLNEVFGALGWLGREGKIEIIKEKKTTKYKLKE